MLARHSAVQRGEPAVPVAVCQWHFGRFSQTTGHCCVPNCLPAVPAIIKCAIVPMLCANIRTNPEWLLLLLLLSFSTKSTPANAAPAHVHALKSIAQSAHFHLKAPSKKQTKKTKQIDCCVSSPIPKPWTHSAQPRCDHHKTNRANRNPDSAIGKSQICSDGWVYKMEWHFPMPFPCHSIMPSSPDACTLGVWQIGTDCQCTHSIARPDW